MKNEKYEDNKANVLPSRAGYLFQYAVALSATLSLASARLAFGWTSPTLPILLGENSPLPITPDESSWIVSFLTLGSIIATSPFAWCMDKIGRKYTLLLSAIPLLISWILIIIAKSVSVLYVARILCGFSNGAAYSILPMYLGEIASDKVRGSISTLLTVMAKVGILYAFAIGPYVSVTLMAWLAMLPIGLFVLTFIWMPESPYYLLGVNKMDEAKKSLIKLRRLNESEITMELERMSIAVQKSKENRGTLKELLQSSGNRRGLIIVMGLASAQLLCGSQAVIAYSEKIFSTIGSQFGASESTIILGVIQLVTAAFSSSIVDRWGRRPLLLLSTAGAAICNGIVAFYFLFESFGNDMVTLSWLPMTAVMIFIVTYTIGLATVPFAILGEIFPKNIKAIVTAVYTVYSGLISFSVNKLFQVVTDNLGPHYTFFGFTIFTTFFLGFILILVPETKGKPLDVILDEINSRSIKRKINK